MSELQVITFSGLPIVKREGVGTDKLRKIEKWNTNHLYRPSLLFHIGINSLCD